MSTRETDRAAYPQIMRAVAETAWAILPSKFAEIEQMLALRAAGHEFTEEELQARIGSGPATRQAQTAGTVAVLPLYGVLVPRADLFTEMSGATSLERWIATFRAFVDDPNIDAIVLDVDSPGGSCSFVQETADAIFEARGSKQIIAVANQTMCSAAYWIASQADEIVGSPSALIGSVGVFAAHSDLTAALEMAGIKTTLVYAGENKVELTPYVALSDDAKAALQRRVNSAYDQFIGAIARGRGLSADKVKTDFGQGRVMPAADAVKAKMADRVDTLESTIERLIGGKSKPSGGRQRAAAPNVHEAAESGLSFADEAAAARDACDSLVNRTTSLAEVRRGRLTAAKREQLGAVATSLSEAHAALTGLLEETDPNQHAAAGLRERARFERLRANF